MQGICIISLLVGMFSTTFPLVAPRLQSTDESGNQYFGSGLDLLQRLEEISNLNMILATRTGCWPHEALCKRSGKTAHMELFDYITKPKFNGLYAGPPAVKPQNPGNSRMGKEMWKELLYKDNDINTK